jgi:uncharacterized protein YlxW (UPF0749 family)
MRTLFFTLLFLSFGVVGFAQNGSTTKSADQSKADQPSCSTSLRSVQEKKSTLPHTTSSNRSAISIISIIPAIKLWLLPANFPNPFTKTED